MKTPEYKRKTSFFRIAAFLFYYVGGIKIFAWIANRYQHPHLRKSQSLVPLITKRQTQSVQILIYHRVNDDGDLFFVATPVKSFAGQMEYLVKNYTVCTLENAVEGISCGNLPDNAVVVTFDDGYKDNFFNAYPILKRLSIPATIFLATDAIGADKPLWHDQVFLAFRATRRMFLEGIGEEPQGYPLRTPEEKRSALLKVLRFLWSIEHSKRSYWVERLVQQLDVPGEVDSSGLMLTWEDVRTMHRDGISFGSHTLSHPILTRMSPAEAKREIYGSKRIIEEMLASPVTTFAYPVGRKEDFNQSIKAMVKEAGYLCAATTTFGANDIHQDLFELKRGNPWEGDLPSFATKMSWYKFTT